MKPLSIKLRLSLLISLLTLAIILVVSVVAYIEVQESLLRNIDELLRVVGEGILAALDGQEDAAALDVELGSIIGSDNPGVPVWCRIWTEGTEEDLFSSGLLDYVNWAVLLDVLPDEQPKVGQSIFFSTPDEIASDGEHPYRVLWMRCLQDQAVINVLVGRSSHYVHHELTEFYQLLLVVGTGLTLLAFLLTPILISLGLRPVEQVGAQLQTITRKNLKQERWTPEVVPELKPFIAALDDMLARLHEAMRQQEQFVADAAHELRTPVAVVKSTLQTIRLRPRNTPEYEQGIDESLQDLARLERLIGQLLSLARLEGTDEMSTAKVCLNSLLDDTIRTFENRAAQEGGRIVLAESPVTWVRGDEDQLRQLFGNLLDNALRHGPAGGTVHVRMEDASDGGVMVFVCDEGGHIPPETLAHLFERFYRVDSSRAQTSGGSGLGLAIVREIADRHGGTVAITSDPQAGTCVAVHLPRLEVSVC